jgi:hypothetical protein
MKFIAERRFEVRAKRSRARRPTAQPPIDEHSGRRESVSSPAIALRGRDEINFLDSQITAWKQRDLLVL